VNKLIIGEFASERFWENQDVAKLPQIPDTNANAIVHAMDELLFPFCKNNDVLVTRYGFNPLLKEYLTKIGVSFTSNTEPIQGNNDDANETIFQLISNHPEKIKKLLPDGNNPPLISHYSIVPGLAEMAANLSISINMPSLETVKKVNSKTYSCELSHSLGIPIMGTVVRDEPSLISSGMNLLKSGSFLIKSPFGVSGNGNFLISSPTMLSRIAKHLKKQSEKGLLIEFVLEPLLDKAQDFSCNFMIQSTGSIDIISIQQMINHGFNYMGSMSANDELLKKLEQSTYYESVKHIGQQLYNDGYFGEVCLDSMILNSGDIIPIVEINARKSFGLINHHLDQFLAKYNQQGKLLVLNINYPKSLLMDDIFNLMEKENLLYYPDNSNGIMLLSSNTLFINKTLGNYDENMIKGRLYTKNIAGNEEESNSLLIHMKSVLEKLSCKIQNR